MGKREPADLALKPVEYWADSEIGLRLSSRVTSLKPAEARVELDTGESIRADHVVLATGGRPRPLRVTGADLGGVHYLRSIDDALAIRGRLQAGGPVVVVGGGFIGAEVASSALSLGCPVTMVEAGDVPFAQAVGVELGSRLARLHVEAGVRVLTRTVVAAIEGDSVVRRVHTSRGHVLDASTVVIGIGIEPAVELAQTCGIAARNGIPVDDQGRTTNPHVLAVGDVAEWPTRRFGRIRLEHWLSAQEQGAVAAHAILGEPPPDISVPWFWSDQLGRNLQMAGRVSGEDRLTFRGDPQSDSYSAMFVRDGLLRAVFSVNRPKDVRAGMRLIQEGCLIDRALLMDESVAISALGRGAT